MLQWADSSLAYFVRFGYQPDRAQCAFLPPERSYDLWTKYVDDNMLYGDRCEHGGMGFAFCEVNSGKEGGDHSHNTTLLTLQSPGQGAVTFTVPCTRCPDGHHTHKAFACYQQSACWAGGRDVTSCQLTEFSPLPPSFECTDGFWQVPYSLVCDHHSDCSDTSDEDFCTFPKCDVKEHVDCLNNQVGV